LQTDLALAQNEDPEAAPPTNRDASSEPHPIVKDLNLEVQVVYHGLKNPTSMEFLGTDDILVLYKNDGTVRRIINATMMEEPVLDENVANLLERGMLGIAIVKRDSRPPYVFLYYTQSQEDGDDDTHGTPPLGNRLYRYELVGGKLENQQLLLDIPANRGATHNGGKILIGPDNNLYLVVGDVAGHKTRSQNYFNEGSASGTSVIWKITQDGRSAGSILGRDEPISKFYAYGIRNSFGMDFDPLTGKLWNTESGPDHGDEINLVEPGFNSGWEVVSGFPDEQFDPEKELVKCLYCTPRMFPLEYWFNAIFFGIKDGKYSDPEFSWNEVVVPTTIKFLNSDKLGKRYANDIFVGDYLPGNLYHFELNENRDELVLNSSLADKVSDNSDELEPIIFGQGFGSITDIDVGPDGYLYVLTYSKDAVIYRIVPEGTAPPVYYPL
jgi:glucose/arabinose dehydrogenase